MKKNTLKIIFDILIAALLFMLYKKNAVSMRFHELAGLILCGLFIVHMSLNWKWIISVTRRIFDKSLPRKTRIGYIINCLLALSTVMVAVSGISISKTLFSGLSANQGFWKPLHYSSAAAILVLAGIHIGLHWPLIKGVFAKAVRLPRVIARPLGIACLIAIVAYGGYSVATTGLIKWISAPVSIMTVSDQGTHVEGQEADGQARIGHDNGQKNGQGQGSQQSFSYTQLFELLLSFGSITAALAILTALLEKALKMRTTPVVLRI